MVVMPVFNWMECKTTCLLYTSPLFWGENDTFITIYNEPMLVMLQKIHGVQAEKEVLKLDFDRRIAASIHNHHH